MHLDCSAARCRRPAFFHVRFRGHMRLAACLGHLPLDHPAFEDHPIGFDCEMPGAVWDNELNTCVVHFDAVGFDLTNVEPEMSNG